MLIQPLTPEIIEKRRAFRRKTWRGIGWTLALAFVAHCAVNIYASVLLGRELAAIRQKGEPLTMSEIAPPAVPDSQNAALLYAAATKSLIFSSEEKMAFRTFGNTMSPRENPLLVATLNKNRRALDLTRRAALMPRCNFLIDWKSDNPMNVKFSYFSTMRELARLLALQTRLEAQNGDRESAMRDVRALFGLSHHLSNETTLIGFVTAQAFDALANQTLAQVIENTPLTLAQARSLENSLPKEDWNRAFQRFLKGERVWGISIFGSQRKNREFWTLNNMGKNQILWSYYPLNLAWQPVLKLDQVQYLRLWKPQIVAARSHQFPHLSNGDQAVQNLPRYALLSRVLYPVFNSATIFLDAAEVRQRQREIALALAVYRTANGHYPAQLSEITTLNGKPLPLDPYNQKPFAYRREGKGFVLYSVGLNKMDNSSKNSLQSPLDNAQDDLLWSNPFKGSFRLAKP